MGNGEIKYEIKERIDVISKNRSSTKELNLISFNGEPAKYDLRTWLGTDDKRMGKGITFTGEELIRLRDCLNRIEIEGDIHE